MDTNEPPVYSDGSALPSAPPPLSPAPPPERGSGYRKAAGPVAVLGALLLKFKAALILLVKFLPVLLKTGGTMFISIAAYSMAWGWRFAAGFVILIFVHECGHLIAAKRLGLRVGAPVFIPFMGALIALKEAPRNAWIEAQVGIGGPLLGALGSAVCYEIAQLTGNPLFSAIAFSGFFLNLFNLAPFGFLDGGRIASALSPWLWLVGSVIIGGMMVLHFNLVLLFIFIFSLPRLMSLFRKRTDEEKRYYEVTAAQRLLMSAMYFGLIVFLVFGMYLAEVEAPGRP